MKRAWAERRSAGDVGPWLCALWLALSACAGEPQFPERAPPDLSVTQGGASPTSEASVDTGATTADGLLDCQGGDAEYFQRIARLVDESPTLQQCTRDEDCTVWQPSWSCEGATWSVYACGVALKSDALADAELARTRIARDVCGRLRTQPCFIGVSCIAVEAHCVAGRCRTTAR